MVSTKLEPLHCDLRKDFQVFKHERVECFWEEKASELCEGADDARQID